MQESILFRGIWFKVDTCLYIHIYAGGRLADLPRCKRTFHSCEPEQEIGIGYIHIYVYTCMNWLYSGVFS